jgi:hypothetical protein
MTNNPDEWEEFKKTLGTISDEEIEKNTETITQEKFLKEIKK